MSCVKLHVICKARWRICSHTKAPSKGIVLIMETLFDWRTASHGGKVSCGAMNEAEIIIKGAMSKGGMAWNIVPLTDISRTANNETCRP